MFGAASPTRHINSKHMDFHSFRTGWRWGTAAFPTSQKTIDCLVFEMGGGAGASPSPRINRTHGFHNVWGGSWRCGCSAAMRQTSKSFSEALRIHCFFMMLGGGQSPAPHARFENYENLLFYNGSGSWESTRSSCSFREQRISLRFKWFWCVGQHLPPIRKPWKSKRFSSFWWTSHPAPC